MLYSVKPLSEICKLLTNFDFEQLDYGSLGWIKVPDGENPAGTFFQNYISYGQYKVNICKFIPNPNNGTDTPTWTFPKPFINPNALNWKAWPATDGSNLQVSNLTTTTIQFDTNSGSTNKTPIIIVVWSLFDDKVY